MSEPVGWLRAVVDAADPSRLAEFWPEVLGGGVNDFTVVLPLPPDVTRKAYGPKGAPG